MLQKMLDGNVEMIVRQLISLRPSLRNFLPFTDATAASLYTN